MPNNIEVNVKANVTGQTDVSKLGAEIDGLGTDAQAAAKGTSSAAAGVDKLGAAAKQAAQGAESAAAGISKTSAAAAAASGSYTKTREGLQSISTQLAQTQQAMAQLRDMMLAGFSAQAFIQAAADMEKMQAGLTAVAGSSDVARQQMDFVRQMATRAGVDVTAAASAFLGLAAATKGTAVEGEPARQVFEAVTTAMAKAGKGSAETQNALLALSQIASKGTVSMEELRGQLGEALPGALQAAANGLGITTKDLISLVESGQLAAEDLFPALAKGLNELYGTAPSAQTLSQEITNIKNAFVEMASHIGESGVLDALKTGAEAAQTAITLLGTSFVVAGKEMGVLAAAITTLDFSRVKEEFAAIEAESRDKLVKAAQHNTVLAAAIRSTGDDATKAALAIAQAGDSTAQAGQQAEQASTGYTKLATDYGKVRKELEDQIELASKELESVKARGQASIEQSKVLGNEAEARKAVAKAAADEAAASAQLAERKQTELNVLKVELASKQSLFQQDGKITEQRKKEFADLEQLIAKKQLDVDKTNAQAAASQAKAKANSEEVLAAKSLADITEAAVKARTADAQASMNLLQGQKSLADQAVEMARLSGNDQMLRQAKIKQLEIEIKLIQAKAAVMKAEAEGEIAVANAKRAELQASGALTEAKRIELDAAIKLAESKIKLAEATGQSTAGLDKMLLVLRTSRGALDDHARGAHGAASAQGSFGAAVDKTTAALEKQNAVRERTIAAQEKENELKDREEKLRQKRLNIDSEGFSLNTAGQRVQQQTETENSIYKQLMAAGYDARTADAKARELYAQYKVWANGTSNPVGKGLLGSGAAADAAPEWLLKPWQQIMDDAIRQDQVRGTASRGTSASGQSSSTGTAASRTVNVKLGKRTAKAASQADASQIVAMLKEAQRAA